MATWDTSQFNFMTQTADQMADNRFQRLAQEQAENERRFRRDLAQQSHEQDLRTADAAERRAQQSHEQDLRTADAAERRAQQSHEQGLRTAAAAERRAQQSHEQGLSDAQAAASRAAAAERRAQQSHEQGLSDAQAAASRAAAAERRAQTAWEQSQAAARQQREQEDLTRRYNSAQHSDLAQAYYRLSSGDNFANLPLVQQQALRTGIPTITDVPVGTDGESIARYYRSLQPQDLIRLGIIPEYAEEYRRRRAADPHLEQTRANQAAALAAQRQQFEDAELARQFAGLTPAQRAAAYLRSGKKYNDLPPELQQIVYNGARANGTAFSDSAVAAWLNNQPELDNQAAFTALINRQGQGHFTYAPSAPSSGQRPAPAAGSSERSQSRPAPSGGQQQGGSTPEPLSENQSTAVYAYEKLHRNKDNISETDPLKGLDDKEKAAFIRVFGNGAENLTADQVRAILNNPYAFSVFGHQYASGDARNRILTNIPQARAASKSQQPAAQEETVQQRFTHLSNDQQQALMAFMAMRENHVPFSSLPQDQQAAFRKVFMPEGQTRFKLQTGDGENNLKPGETATEQVTATPEDIAASGDMSAIFGLQTTDQARENENTGRTAFNTAVAQAEQAREQAEFQRYQDLARQALTVNGHYENDQYGNRKWVADTVPDDKQVDALARIMQRYGLPVDKAVEIFRSNASLAQLNQMNAEKYRTISQMYGTAFTGLSMPEQAAFLKYYNDFATRYQEIVGDKTDSSQLSAEQRQQLNDLDQRWHQLTWDAGQRTGEKVDLPSPFAALVSELEAESAQADITTFFQQYPEIGEALERNNGDWKKYYGEYTGGTPYEQEWDRLAAVATDPQRYQEELDRLTQIYDISGDSLPGDKIIDFYKNIFPKLLEYQRLVQTEERARGDQQQFRLQANPPQPRFRYVPSSSTR